MTTHTPPHEAPPGFRYVVASDEGWTVPPVGVGRCRFGSGGGRKACGRPAVATLWRSHHGGGKRPWNYCEDHLYGRWIEDGRVSAWRLVPDERGNG